jgi:RimJ/RimL family protein N-acetyltransferase
MKYLIPTTINTERLVLRMFREGDWHDLHEYYGDADCTTYTSRRPLKDYETCQRLAALVDIGNCETTALMRLRRNTRGK